jgi:hypothetical protein
MGGSKYFITFIDDFSRRVWAYFMKRKNQSLEKFQEFKAHAEVQCGQRIGSLRSDNGGEYKSKAFDKLCVHYGILRQYSQAYTPTQNGTAERMNRTLTETARCLSFETPVPLYLWPETISTADYLINRRPASKFGHRTPEELFTKKRPDLSHLRIFGSATYVLIPIRMNGKMAPKSRKAIMVGYNHTSKCYHCYVPSLKKIVISRDVQFNEGNYQSIIWTETSPVPPPDFCLPLSRIARPATQLLPTAQQPPPVFIPMSPLTPVTEPLILQSTTSPTDSVIPDHGGMPILLSPAPIASLGQPVQPSSPARPDQAVALAPIQVYSRREKPQPRRSFRIR